VTGVVNLNRYRGKEKFTERDLKLAQIFVHDAAVAIRSARLMEDSKQRMVLEEKNRLLFRFLSRYVPEKMALQILEDPGRYLTLGGERVDLTILFADIRGFTHFAATNEPEKVVETLNHIFTELTKVVFANSGYINKFIGDCLMSIYDKQYTGGNEVFMALKTAVEMQGVFKKIIEEQIHSNGLGLGIGVNSGEVVIGNIGSEDLMDYTVIGDNVNIALLLEEQAKGGQILISRDTYQRIQDKIEAKRLPPQPLRGRAGEIEVYEMLGVKE
jgi:adenylate cyclase